MVCAIHRHESATGAHVSPHPESPTHLPPDPMPLALSALFHAANLHWSSISHILNTLKNGGTLTAVKL